MKIELGKMNELEVKKIYQNLVYLRHPQNTKQEVPLPKEELPEDKKEGDIIEVFIYNNSKDQLAATTKKPLAMVDELAYLKTVDATSIGAFMYLGLEKDLFVPIKEQTIKPEKNKSYLVKVYLDKSNRLCGTMKVEDYLKLNDTYTAGDIVQGTVYKLKRELGAFVAVENKYYGLLHNSECLKTYSIGDRETFRIVKAREDGKLDLSTKKLAHQQMEEDANEIVKTMIKNKGFLPLNDNSSPDEIKKYFKISKNAFKRAIGKLLKEKIIQQDSDGIRFKKEKYID